jgi:hypothetical protein
MLVSNKPMETVSIYIPEPEPKLTNELRIYNGKLQQKVLIPRRKDYMVLFDKEIWEDVPIINEDAENERD